MRITYYLFIFALLFYGKAAGQQQDCTLAIGGKDTEVIIKVFQLNDAQQVKLMTWTGELQHYNKVKADEIRLLFDTHPQQTTEELQQMAGKYKTLQDEIEANSKAFDLKLLSIFDQRQYERYVALCREVGRQAMNVAAAIRDTPGPE
jgi:aminoglycoside phosphotransferase family enzyme